MSSVNSQAKLVTYLMLKNGKKVFLVQYRESPNPKREGWWIPAPELKYGEHPEDCAKRIVTSLGIVDAKLAFQGVDSFVTKDWHVMFYYTATTSDTPQPAQEYENGQWFDLDQLPEAKAFAHGGWERDLVIKLAQS